MDAVKLIAAIIATSIYICLTPFMLVWMMFQRDEERVAYARKEEERTEPPFTLESDSRVELFRKCVGQSVAAVPVRRVQSEVRSRELVSAIAQTEDTLFLGKLRKTERGERAHASLRRVRSNAVRDRKTERKDHFS